jgi:alkaline phosphatase D
MTISRRSFLGIISGSTFFATVGALPVRGAEMPAGAPALTFPQGVASGDPRQDSVMLWTRAVPVDATGDAPMLLQLSDSEAFGDVLLEQQLSTNADSDFTVRAFIDGLEPGTHYYYRFLGGNGTVSRTGRAMTARALDDQRPVNLAFASCQSFEQAYYGSWARLIADDRQAAPGEQLDFILHLGDFIYERSWHKRLDGSDQSRYVPQFPDGEHNDENRHAVSLADYRHLYKVYLSDPHLQEARARWPFLCIWDDHEFSNDCYQSYNTYGDEPLCEPQRKLDANQAWFEFIPAVLSDGSGSPAHDFSAIDLPADEDTANASAVSSLCIYRRLRWGAHVDIFLTDTRSYRSEAPLPKHFAQQLGLPMNTVQLVDIADGGRAFNNGTPPDTLPYADTPNPARDREPGTCLGAAQKTWMLEGMADSTAGWKLWGNAIPLLPLRLDLSSIPMAGYEDSLFSIDPWAGYPHELRQLMDAVAERNIAGLVSFSGDHHMHGAATINRSPSEPASPAVCVDFSVAGISSTPLFANVEAAARDNDDFRPLVYTDVADTQEPTWNMTLMQGALASIVYDRTGIAALSDWLGPNEANPGLAYTDTTANGFGRATFTKDELRVSMVTMEDLRQPFEQPPAVKFTTRFRVTRWKKGAAPALEGPVFDGPPPFPFSLTTV